MLSRLSILRITPSFYVMLFFELFLLNIILQIAGLRVGWGLVSQEDMLIENIQEITLLAGVISFGVCACLTRQNLRILMIGMFTVMIVLLRREIDWRAVAEGYWLYPLIVDHTLVFNRAVEIVPLAAYALLAPLMLLLTWHNRSVFEFALSYLRSRHFWPFLLVAALAGSGRIAEILSSSAGTDSAEAFYEQFWEELLELDAYYILFKMSLWYLIPLLVQIYRARHLKREDDIKQRLSSKPY